jgi:hypothetical protein
MSERQLTPRAPGEPNSQKYSSGRNLTLSIGQTRYSKTESFAKIGLDVISSCHTAYVICHYPNDAMEPNLQVTRT